MHEKIPSTVSGTELGVNTWKLHPHAKRNSSFWLRLKGHLGLGHIIWAGSEASLILYLQMEPGYMGLDNLSRDLSGRWGGSQRQEKAELEVTQRIKLEMLG